MKQDRFDRMENRAPIPAAPRPSYRVTFERIGRNHFVEPQTFVAAHADELAHIIYGFARTRLASHDVEVVVDLEAGEGTIYCGFSVGGKFTIEAAS